MKSRGIPAITVGVVDGQVVVTYRYPPTAEYPDELVQLCGVRFSRNHEQTGKALYVEDLLLSDAGQFTHERVLEMRRETAAEMSRHGGYVQDLNLVRNVTRNGNPIALGETTV